MEDVVEGGILVGEQVVFARHINPIVRRESSASIKKFQHRKSITSLHASSSNDEIKDSNEDMKTELYLSITVIRQGLLQYGRNTPD